MTYELKLMSTPEHACEVCADSSDAALMLYCSSCGMRAHRDCYLPSASVQPTPDGANVFVGAFECQACAAGVKPEERRCALCDRGGGALLRRAAT